jgi:hypothetical protein
LQYQQQQGREGEDNVDFVERVFLAAVKRAPSAREEIGHTKADDDGHERGDELEAAHQVLSVLHGVLSLRGAALKSKCK